MAFTDNIFHKASCMNYNIKRHNLIVFIFITVAVLISITVFANLLPSSNYFLIINDGNSNSVLYHTSFNPVTCPKCASNSSENETLDPTLWIPEEPFVYFKSYGGLGNQLFQFASVYTIAKKNKLPLLVHVDSKPGSDPKVGGSSLSHGEFALHLLNVPLPRYDTKRVHLISDYINEARHHSRIQGLGDATVLAQDYKVTNNSILTLGGFCQSELFFHPYRDEIKKFFTPKNIKNSSAVVKWKSVIDGVSDLTNDPVCVHVRRGDFTRVSNRLVNTTFYLTAMDEMRNRLGEIGRSASFFVFSDDISKVKADFKGLLSIAAFDELQWVSDSEKSLVEDLYLMSQCRHNIMSASSFGWWGAYLNDYPEKIVIAAHHNPKIFSHPSEAFLYRHTYYPLEWYIKDFIN